MTRFFDIVKGAELLSGTIAFFAILGLLAFFGYAFFVRLPEERFEKMNTFLDKHIRVFGLATLAFFLVLALLLHALKGK